MGAIERQVVWMGSALKCILPACNAFGQRFVDVLERFLGSGTRFRVLAMTQTIKGAPGLYRLFRFERKEGKLEGCAFVGGVQAHGGFEFVARRFVLAHFHQSIGKIFMRPCPGRLESQSFAEKYNGPIVVFRGQSFIALVQVRVAGSDTPTCTTDSQQTDSQ